MKGRRFGVTGFFIGTLFGVAVAYLAYSIFALQLNFILGFVACIVCVAGGSLIFGLWKPGSSSMRGSERPSDVTGLRTLITGCIALVGVIGGILIYQQQKTRQAMTAYEDTHLAQQAEWIESTRQSGLLALMGQLFDKIEDEMSRATDRAISDATIARLAALSYAFEPGGYHYLEVDSLSGITFNPGRGQMLFALAHLDMAPESFERIRFQVSFAGADLSGADLSGLDLGHTDLMCADLRNADLRGTHLQNADLRGAKLWGARLDKADLTGAKLNRADLSWAQLNEAKCPLADLRGADLKNAKLRGADLSKADLEWADLSGAMLNEVKGDSIDLFGAILTRAILKGAHLNHADLRKADLRHADFHHTSMREAQVNKAIVHSDHWFDAMLTSNVIGVSDIQNQYKIVTQNANPPGYLIEKREN